MRQFINHPTDYLERPRHWCPRSEPYTGTDSLLTALLEGWEPHKQVFCEQIQRSASRVVNVYHFLLKRGDAHRMMVILGNPRTQDVIRHYELRISNHTFEETTQEAFVRRTAEVPAIMLDTARDTVEATAITITDDDDDVAVAV